MQHTLQTLFILAMLVAVAVLAMIVMGKRK